MRTELLEGDKCPKCNGKMRYPPAKNCSCHVIPPCPVCKENMLTCDQCGFEFEDGLIKDV